MIKPLLKICGVRNIADAQFCESIGVDFIGLNFIPTSKRHIDLQTGIKICGSVRNIKTVGIFLNQPIDYVNSVAQQLDLHYIQLAGDEDVRTIKQCNRPVIKTISIRQKNDLKPLAGFIPHVAYFIIDGPNPGSGETFSWDILGRLSVPYFIAGGINASNVVRAVSETHPLGVDIASGIESNGIPDQNKIEEIKLILGSIPEK